MKRPTGKLILASTVGFLLSGAVSHAQMKVETVSFEMQPLTVSFDEAKQTQKQQRNYSDEVEIILDEPTAATADQLYLFFRSG